MHSLLHVHHADAVARGRIAVAAGKPAQTRPAREGRERRIALPDIRGWLVARRRRIARA
jgi:hypothetical protein